ncbi:Sec-independent protein translocase family protein [Nesterenkonia ebinurensis]|uniref:hypothetical protein n=1 Tax=Nesterenkonia ebinurensis TaxID=2608252 RepID=UPI00123D2BA0|nr:hypothetical protein [Nesterenkonia ebinurensis]
MPGINFYEFLILIVLALVLLGPERLPTYAQTLARWVRRARSWADDAKVRFREETGTDFDEVDWQKYDPRQYDPRRIIREALAEDYDEAKAAVGSVKKAVDPVELFGGAGSQQTAKSGGALAAGVAGSAAAGTTVTGQQTDNDDADPLTTAPAPYDSEAT